tara:strand:+ start:267 stop:452 length:186 start_codon:yes stop_codon:yes gene_type:complete
MEKKALIGKKLYSTETVNGIVGPWGKSEFTCWTPHQGYQYIFHGLHCTMWSRCLEKFTTPE